MKTSTAAMATSVHRGNAVQSNLSPRSGVLSLGIHSGLLFLLLTASRLENVGMIRPAPRIVVPLVSPFLRTAMHHDAGGSSPGTAQIRAGSVPKRATRIFIAPVVARPMLQPEIAIEAPDLLVDSRLPNFGDPLSAVLTGTGGGNGMGGLGRGRQGAFGDDVGPGVAGDPNVTVYRPGNGVTAPALIHSVDPEFSDEARKAKFSGSVALRIDVDPSGHARNIRVARSAGMGLDEKAIEAVKQWLFRPGMKAGKPVTVGALVEVSFHLL